MKTEPMAHQVVGVERLAAAPEYFAMGAEQGTGKTWMLLADAEAQFDAGRIDALLVVAPKGVHVNWILREIPRHLSVPHRADFWMSGANAKRRTALAKLLNPPEEESLTILAINIDAFNTKPGRDYALRFLRRYRVMMVVDESQRIKNPAAKRSGHVVDAGDFAVSRRISSGTLVADSPLDLFGQYQFLRPGLLGTTSFRAFTAEYADLLPPHHPIVQDIVARSRGRGSPQVIRRDSEGRPVYRNLDKLRGLLAPHTYRVLKEDCLDLPPKIYSTQYHELSPSTRRMYDDMLKDRRFHRSDGDVDIYTALTLVNKLRQVTSGFVMVDGEAAGFDPEAAAPRIAAVRELVEDADGTSLVIWATYHEEIRQITEALRGLSVVEYHGRISSREREEAVDRFQSGDAQIIVATAAAGGTGLTFTAAQSVIYYSCSYSLEERLQSEDRTHRIGTKGSVLYTDLVARDTIDERIADALQNKGDVAAALMNWL